MKDENRQISEADVIGFFAAATKKYAPLFPEIEGLEATHGIMRCGVGFFGFVRGTRSESISAFAPTFGEAAKKLREKLGAPEAVAAKKREEAARLLAEADALVTPAKKEAA